MKISSWKPFYRYGDLHTGNSDPFVPKAAGLETGVEYLVWGGVGRPINESLSVELDPSDKPLLTP